MSPDGARERPLNFRLLFERAPARLLILRPDPPRFTILGASDLYLRATLTEREEIVGRPLFEVFPDHLARPEVNAVRNMTASLLRVLATKEPDSFPVQKYDIRRQDDDGGGFEERHWSPRNSPVVAEDGTVAYIIHSVEDVTDLVRLKQETVQQGGAIRELSVRSEERYRQLLDAVPDASVVVGDDGRIELVNAQTRKLFGYEASELIGQHLEVLIPERFRQAHEVHLTRYFANPGVRAMGSGLELYGRHKDGKELRIEVSLGPVRIGDRVMVSAAIRDISERKRMEAAAKLLADRLASAVESIQDGFALFDDRDRLVLCNSVYRRLIGEALTGPLVGRPHEEILDGWLGDISFETEEERSSFRADLLARHARVVTFDLRMRDGRSLRAVAQGTPEGGLVTTIWDLTDDVHQSEELREARGAAEAASAAKSEFLSSMSHELRTPLNAILGFAQLLGRDKRQPLSERHKERVDQILKGGEHLLRLIDDILDLSRIEAGGISISTEPVSVSSVLAEVRSTLEPMAIRAGLTFEMVELPGLPAVAADRTRFVQILVNLGSNAIKYNRPGGIVRFKIDVPDTDRVRVTVTDTGIGIAEDQQAKLFQPFQRAGQEAGPIEGTGIGLVITKRLAELMAGSVGFQSVRGEGSSFWLELPLHAVGPPLVAPAALRRSGQLDSRSGNKSLVLYVEDNPSNVLFMKDLLGVLASVELITATTAEEGVELARARAPAVIIMDINLPGMSGLDALTVLRAAPETSAIPVIALTAAATERDRERGEQAGFHRYLTKPIRIDEFEAALEELLER